MPLPSLTRHLPAGHTLQGPAAAVARALNDTLIEWELAVERLLDALEPPFAVDERDLRRVTALVKTFERPDVVRRLVESMQRLYPAMPIIVVDDSRSPVALEGVRVVEMPFDSGIGAGRNKGLEQAETDFVLVLDDDFVFTRKTRLGSALALMERHPEIDVMGGQLVDLPFYFQAPIPRGQIFPTAALPLRPLGSTVGGLEVVDKAQTFLLARRERLATVRWDPLPKRMDHADFFTRALGVLTTVYNPDLRALHARTPFDAKYMSQRMDLTGSRDALAERYSEPVPWHESRKAALTETVRLFDLSKQRPQRQPWIRPFVHAFDYATGRLTRLVFGRGLDTSGRFVDLAHFHSERVPYEPSGWRYLRRVLSPSEVTASDVFVDYGSGKGRIVYQAARYPLKRVIGVEISEKLNEIARANIEQNRSRLRCQDVELVTCDAADYGIPDDMTIAYFYYPFAGETFRRVIDNIVDSLIRNPRRIRLIYACPHLEDVVVGTSHFRLIRSVRIGRHDYLPRRISVYVSDDPGASA